MQSRYLRRSPHRRDLCFANRLTDNNGGVEAPTTLSNNFLDYGLRRRVYYHLKLRAAGIESVEVSSGPPAEPAYQGIRCGACLLQEDLSSNHFASLPWETGAVGSYQGVPAASAGRACQNLEVAEWVS